MPHARSYEELAPLLVDAERLFEIGTKLESVANFLEPLRYVVMYALDEETLKPGVVYTADNKPRELRFCPVEQIETLATNRSRQSLARPQVSKGMALDGTYWRHVKTQGLYRVVQTAFSDVTGAKGVLYYPRGYEHVKFFRPLLSFLGEVEIEGETRPRFEQISFTEFDAPQARG